MTRKLMAVSFALLAKCAVALSAYSNGYLWEYELGSGTETETYGAKITGIDPSPVGSLTVPSSLGGYQVVSISLGYWHDLTQVTEIILPSCLKEIDDYGLSDAGINSISLPNGLVRIGSGAFSGCARLNAINIPASVYDLDGGLGLAECPAKISVAAANPYYSSDEQGFLYDKGKTDLLIIPENVSSVKILSSVRSLSSGIPGTVTSFSVAVGNTVFAMADGCLYSADMTTLVAVPRNARSVTIRQTVKQIGSGAFASCKNIVSVSLPDGVATIGSLAFAGCSSLSEINVPSSVAQIGSGAFGNCKSLESIGIPSSVAKVGNSAFSGCASLTNVSLPGVAELPSSVFSGCTSLLGFSINGNVASIGANAFRGCKSLVSLVIPASVAKLGDGAFRNCSSLNAVYYLCAAKPTASSNMYDGTPESLVSYVCWSLGNTTKWANRTVRSWTPTLVAVRFNANGGTVSENTRSCLAGYPYGALPTPVRSGYVFTGWFTSVNGGDRVGEEDDVMASITLYAHWVRERAIVVRSFESAPAGGVIRLVLGREGPSNGKIAVKVKTQTSTGICGTDFGYVKKVVTWEDGDTSDKVIEIPTYASGAGKSLRVKLATLTTGDYAGYVAPKLAESKVYADMLQPNPGTIVVTAPDPLSVVAGDVLRMTFSRVGGSDGKIAVKAKTQSSTAIMGVNGSADFDYVKTTFEWTDGDTSDRHLNIPTYIGPWEGVKMLRVKLATLATGAYAGNLVPALDQSKVYVDIKSPCAFGTVYVAPDTANPQAGQTLRLVFRRVGGSDCPIAVKYKVQTSTAIAGVDFVYKKGVVVWGDGEAGSQIVEVPTYPSAAGKQLRVKLSTLTQGDYAGHVTPHLNSAKVYVRMQGSGISRGKVQLWNGGPYWAETNIGADEPWEYGYYFWWGDTVGYKRENDAWVASDGSSSNFSFTFFNAPTYGKDKSTLQTEGWITADEVLAPVHDAAHVHWGGGWRMPTKQELDDLNSKCDCTWTTMNGVKGYVVRGRGDYASNSIFLPAAGLGEGESFHADDVQGFYWSSLPVSDYYDDHSWFFVVGSGAAITLDICRQHGLSVRPVQGVIK